MKIIKIKLLILLLLSCFVNANEEIQNHSDNTIKDLDIFIVEKKDNPIFYFTSVSEKINFNSYDENGNARIVPHLIPDEIGNYKKDSYKLTKIYRQRFLKEAGISEDDNFYLYDYEHNRLITYPIRKLEAFAIINIYSIGKTPHHDEKSYQFGFKLNLKQLPNLNPKNTFVYIGKESPFAMQQLTRIDWQKIDNQDFPNVSNNNDTSVQNSITQSYLAQLNELNYYLQDEIIKHDNFTGTYHRKLVIADNEKNIFTYFEYSHTESSRIGSLTDKDFNEMNKDKWTGKLFKNQPLVAFGFESMIFPYSYIYYIDPLYTFKRLDIKSDYRQEDHRSR